MIEEEHCVFEISRGCLCRYNGSDEVVHVPSGVREIGDNAFEGKDCVEVFLPDGVRSIGEKAFARCVRLRYIYMPDSIKEIKQNAFFECFSLCGMRLP